MNRRFLYSVLVALVITTGGASLASAGDPYMWPVHRAQYYDWNKRYYYTPMGQPVSLVVPPTATMQTNWGWGVGSSRLQRLDHQFGRNYPGDETNGMGNRSTPIWPSDTTQFGVYYVRGPW